MLQKKTGDLVTWDMKKAEVFNEVFASVFTSKWLQPHHTSHRIKRQGLGQ